MTEREHSLPLLSGPPTPTTARRLAGALLIASLILAVVLPTLIVLRPDRLI